MEAGIQVCTKNVDSAKSIKLSTNTHKLIMCRAMLSDIHETVVDVVGERYGGDQDGHLENFRNRIGELDTELSYIIGVFVEVASLEGDFETGGFKEL